MDKSVVFTMKVMEPNGCTSSFISINEIEILKCVPFGGKQQHGFIKNKSTVTAGLVLQSLIARAMDDDCYVALAGIDLSAAFDVVDFFMIIHGKEMCIGLFL